LEWINDVRTRNASQPGKYLLCKIKVSFAENALFRVIGMAVRNTEVVFKNEFKSTPGGLGYMQEYDHSITADRKSLLQMRLNWGDSRTSGRCAKTRIR
jgi:hypothetical protein